MSFVYEKLINSIIQFKSALITIILLLLGKIINKAIIFFYSTNIQKNIFCKYL